jgi:hypothetical protein
MRLHFCQSNVDWHFLDQPKRNESFFGQTDFWTVEALGAYQKAEIEKWWPIIKAAGIKAE